MQRIFLLVSAVVLFAGAAAGKEPQPAIAITSVTLIDGNGGPLKLDTTVIVENGVIGDIRQARSARVPPGAIIIDGTDRYLLPGFIDSNVHATVYGNSRRRETVVKYGHRNADLALEFAQRQLKYGVTTIRDSYGALIPLMEQEAGIGSILAIEGLVELGMNEMQAIVAATRNGAAAAGMADQIGTLDKGKSADLVLLQASPLEDIRNVRRIEQVIARGRLVDIAALPEEALFSVGAE
jgi:imidazolonepropionase-like amidohydrolase